MYMAFFRPLADQQIARERTEDKLKQSGIQYRCLFDILDGAALVIDIPTGRIIDANVYAEMLLCRSGTTIVGENQDDLFPLEGREEISVLLRRREMTRVSIFEAEVQNAAGRRTPVEVTAVPLTLSGRELVIALLRDRTRFKTFRSEPGRVQSPRPSGPTDGVAHEISNLIIPVLPQ